MTAPAPLPENDEPTPGRRPRAEPRRRSSTGARRPSGGRERAAPRDRAPAAAPRRSGDRGAPAGQQGRGRSEAARRAYARRAERARGAVARGALAKRTAAGWMGLPTPSSVLSSRATFVVVVMSLLAVGVVATLWLSTQATAGTYRLEKLKQHVGGLNHQVATLRSDVAREQSPASLAAKARQLGMVPAGVPARLKVGEDGKVTVVGTPTKAAPPKHEHSAGDTSGAGDPGAASDRDAHQQAGPPPHGGG